MEIVCDLEPSQNSSVEPFVQYPRRPPESGIEQLHQAFNACNEADKAVWTWVGAWGAYLATVALTVIGVTSAPGLIMVVYLLYAGYFYGAVKSSWFVASVVGYPPFLASILAFLMSLIPLSGLVLFVVQQSALKPIFEINGVEGGYLGPNRNQLRSLLQER